MQPNRSLEHTEVSMAEATILFSDIRNFTATAERLSVTEVARILAEYFERACEILVRHGGHHVKVMGDGLMAVFDDGTLAARSPHARRALAAAVELREHAREFQDWLDTWFAERELPRFAIGIGVHSGEVMFARIASAEVTPLGDAVNTASRLEAMTKQLGWAVVASEQTLALAGTPVATGGSRVAHVRGRAVPVNVHEVLGEWRLVRKIGEGGAAEVFLAQSPARREPVVLKLLRLGASDDAARRRRFLREFEVLSALAHPHIARIHGQRVSGPLAWIEMEYLEGGSLRQRLVRPFAPGEALAIVRQAALALQALHAHGCVHRDLKPENLLFRGTGELVLADFGVVKAIGDTAADGEFAGTPYYASPEQIAGADVGVQADFYSLGVILFELLAGRRPYVADNVELVLARHRFAAIPRLPAQCAHLQPLVDRLMAKAPEARFADAAALLRALDGLEHRPARPHEQGQAREDLAAQ